MTTMNRQWLLASRPEGTVTVENFRYREIPVPAEELKPNEILIRNLVFLCAPSTRNRMKAGGDTYYSSSQPQRRHKHPDSDPNRHGASIPLGTPVMSPTAGQIIKSANPDFPVGRCVSSLASSGWQDYTVLDPSQSSSPPMLCPEGVTPTDCAALYGINALTAYFGVLRVGEPQPGETLVVSAAAGSTGSMAAQIGKIKGCRVIGIAGGREKCEWLLKACHLDAVIDYKSEPVSERLRELCPKGIDIFFDNVGGDILQAAVDNIAIRGRILLCGQISGYNDGNEPVPGPRDMMRLVYGRVRMQGFLGSDYPAERDAALADIMRWVSEGKIAHREDIREGFENLPIAFCDLFTGANKGTLLVKIGDPAPLSSL